MAGMFVTGLALFVGAIGIMNITYVSVKERTREIGTRKAVGARKRTILLQFLVEAVSICLVGGGIGVALSWLMSASVAAAFPSFPMTFSFGLVFLGLIVSTITGILSGILPAISAARLDPIEALRYE
jgi:putative ABC transport system permease protein